MRIQERFYPLPNTGNTTTLVANNYRETVDAKRSKPYYATARLDHNFSDTDRMFGRFTFHQATNPVWEGNLPAIGMRQQLRQNKAVTFSYTRILGPSLVNEFRYGHAYNNNPIAGPIRGLELIDSLGLRGLAPGLPDIGGILKVSFPGTALTGLSQIDVQNPGFLNRNNQFQDQITWLRGTHSLKFGTEIRRVDWEEMVAPANLFGPWTSPGASRGPSVRRLPARRAEHRVARVSAGAGAAAAAGPTTSSRRTTGRSRRNLTINLGLRYDLHPGWFERDGRLAAFDIDSRAIVIADDGMNKVSPLMPAGYVGIVTREQRGPAVTHPGAHGPQQLRAAARPRLPAVRRRADGDPRRLRALLRHDADRSPGRPARRSCSRRPRSPTRPTPTVVLPAVFPAAGTAGPSSIALPLAVNPGSADALQPSMERDRRARALEHRIPRLLCRHARPRHVVHARRQRAGSGRAALHREAAAVPAVSRASPMPTTGRATTTTA